MHANKEDSGRHRRSRSLDGIISGNRQLGEIVVRSKQGTDAQNDGDLGLSYREAEGFNPARSGMSPVGVLPTQAADSGALDEPIMLEDVKPPKPKKEHKHPRLRKVFKRSGLSLLVIIILIVGFLGWKLESEIARVFHGNIFSVLHPASKLKGEDQGRVNILLAGNSADDPGHNGANLTDSIMLISLNTVNNTGYLMSIPRDLYVSYGTTDCSIGNRGKINAVYECGQEMNFNQPGYASGGMGLLEKVVGKNFGVNINYYALIDYSGLRDGVNAVGGINFTVNVSDSCGGLYDGNKDYATGGVLVNLSNGTHVLNGEQALDLARARGDPPYQSCGYANGDFTRTQNQRQELLALKTKIFSLGVLSNPTKLNNLLNTFGNSIQTDFKANEILRLYDLSKKIPNDKIQSIGLSDTKVNLVNTADISGISYVVPTAGNGDFSKIQAFMKRLNSNDPVAKEYASVEVLNGTDTNGLAATTGDKLSAKGINVVGTADASLRQTTAIIMLNKSKTATAAYLKSTFNAAPTTDTSAYPDAQGYNTDFVIILGSDAQTQ